MAKVNEKLLLEKGGPAGVAKCADITTLDLSAMQIKDVDTSLFNQLVKLEDLNLSNNRILTFPSGVILPQLKRLDLSDNTISQLHFLKKPFCRSVSIVVAPGFFGPASASYGSNSSIASRTGYSAPPASFVSSAWQHFHCFGIFRARACGSACFASMVGARKDFVSSHWPL